jgi:hypothetical protein
MSRIARRFDRHRRLSSGEAAPAMRPRERVSQKRNY